MVDAEAVVGDRPGAVAVGAAAAQVVHVADAAAEQVVAVRIGRCHDRAEVGVADRERIRQSAVIRDIVARHVTHCDGTLLGRPVVILTLVPSGMNARPTMIRSWQIGETQALQARADAFGIHTERRDHIHSVRRATKVARRYRESRRDVSRAGRLQKDRGRSGAAALEREMDVDRARIGETADTAKRPEMMVERAVLLHQDDNVFHIANRSGAVVCRDCQRLGDVRVERTRDGGHARQLQEFTAVDMAHDVSLSFDCGVRKKPGGTRGWAGHSQPYEAREMLPAEDATMN